MLPNPGQQFALVLIMAVVCFQKNTKWWARRSRLQFWYNFCPLFAVRKEMAWQLYSGKKEYMS
jgi:hypothetical protein